MGNFFKQSILRCDLLSCAPTLRVKGQPAYESIIGGIFSIIIMGFFIVVFYTSFIQVINRVNIDATMSTTDQTQSDNEVADLQFAIGIQGVQLGGGPRYFDIFFEQTAISGNSGSSPTTVNTQVLLTPCSIDNWQDVGDDFQTQFNVFNMDKMLCVADSSHLVMKGYQGSADYQYLSLKIKTCTNNTYQSHPCRTPLEISTFISTYLTTRDFFKVSFLIVDTRISPAQSEPVSKILQKKVFLSFTDALGTKGYISFAHYTISTDTSIWPTTDENEQTGSYIHKYSTSTIGLNSDKFIHLEFFKATQELTVTRAVSKLDEMLSYVGGLFGLLWVIVAFFLGAFNEYRYELYAAQAAFTFDQTGRKIKSEDFGVLSYLCYSIYDWLDLISCAPKKWTRMRQIHQTREQICEQLDVTYLFKKIRSLQKTTACLLNQNKRICSMLTRQITLQETQRQRKMLQAFHIINPSPGQDGFEQNANSNKIQNIDQKTGQQFIICQKFTFQQNQSSVQNVLAVTQQNNIEQEDQEFEQMMNMIKDAYSSIEAQNDDICKRIKQKIPQQIKRAIYKKRMTRQITIDDAQTKKFKSCQNSFVDPKFK